MGKTVKNWRDIDKQPAAISVRTYLRENLLKIRQDEVINSIFVFLRSRAAGKTVLDVGGVGHNIESTDVANWKHNVIKETASSVMGIDLLEEPIKKLNDRGYNFRLCDATSNADLGQGFDLIFAGDVIEHVENPVNLLKFCSRHLNEGGEIICTTPNPFFVGNFRSILKDSLFIANGEHISWITPTNAIELAYRASLTLGAYWHWFDNRTLLKKIMYNIFRMIGMSNSEILPRSYVYLFREKLID